MDMDGVLYRGERPVPGAVETLHTLRQQGVQVAFLTNNASRHRDELVEHMTQLGFLCDLDQMWGSAYTTARYLAQDVPDARPFVVGTKGLVREIEGAGLTVVPTHEGATHVVAGLDREISYEKLKQAHYAICNGAAFIATNADPAYPDSPTTTVPGAGAIIAALRISTGVEPLVIGKPQTTGIALIARAWGVAPQAMAAVGDRLDTDVAAAKTFGCLAILVLTGIATREEGERATGVCKPDVMIDNLTELLPVLVNRG